MTTNRLGRTFVSVSSFLMLAAGALSVAHAQTVTGAVTREESSVNLSGVTVSIPAIGLQATTSADGRFRIPSVPPGTYDVQIDYLGEILEVRQVTVTQDGADIVVNLDARAPDILMDRMIVKGRRGAIQSASALERASDELKSIVTSDDIGQFGDPTVAESLQRIPGVSINRSAGEGQQASIRGLPTQFATVTLDGARLGTSDPSINSTRLDFFSADNLSQIVVTKTLTPEQEADAIAGSIDLKTISALRRGKDSVSGRVEYGYQEKPEKWNPKLSGEFTKLYDAAGGRIGLAGGLTWSDRETLVDEASIGDGLNFFTREEFEDDGELVQEFFQDGDVDDCSDDQEGGTILECFLIPEEVDLRAEPRSRERISLNGQFEFETDNHLFQVRGSYSDSETERFVNRVTFDFSRSDGDVPEGLGTDDPDVDEVVAIGVEDDGELFGVFEDGRAERRLRTSNIDEEVYTIGFEGTSDFGGAWTLNYGVDISRNEENVEQGELRFRSDNIVFDFANFGEDGIDMTLGQEVFDVDDDDPDPTTPEGFPLRTTNVGGEQFGTPNRRFSASKDEFDVFYGNLERRLRLFGRGAGAKVGWRHRERERSFDFTRQEFLVSPDVSLADLTDGRPVENSDLDIPFDVDAGDTERLLADLIANGRIATVAERGTFIAVADTEDDFISTEDVTAGFFQLNFQPIENVTVIAGVRVEHTDFSSAGNALRSLSFSDNVTDALQVALENGGVDDAAIEALINSREVDISIEPFVGENDYTKVFPSVNVRWDPTETVVVRASFTEGIKRPEFGEAAAIAQLQTRERIDDDDLCGVITGVEGDCPTDIETFTGSLGSIDAAEAALSQAAALTDDRPFETEADQLRNPFLEPLKSQNFDASISWYPNANTIFSAAAFYKEIDNFVVEFSTSDTATIQALGFAEDDFTQTSLGVSAIDSTFVNGDTAEIYGLELSYYQAYTFLPAPFDGLFFQGNVTFADSEASSDLIGRDFRFPDQSDTIGNVSIGWENDRFSLRGALVHQGDRLRAVNAGELDNSDEDNSGDELEDDRTQIDISARWDIRENFQLFFDAINITDAEDNRSFRGGSPGVLNGPLFSQRENFGATYQGGVRFKF